MNHFKKYSDQCRKNATIKELIHDFDYILDNIWCTYSFKKGRRRWNKIVLNIHNEYAKRIIIEMQHVLIGHGVEQAKLAVKDEMEKYIEYLLDKED